MVIESIPLAIGFVPVAAYLLMLGWIHLRGRPVVTSSYRDVMVMGLAVTGLVVIGPMQLFFPNAAASRFQFVVVVWLLLLALWFLGLTLVALSQRPRVIIYGGRGRQVRDALEQIVRHMDPQAIFLGNLVRLPERQMQFEIEDRAVLGIVQVCATRSPQNLDGWSELHGRLRDVLRQSPSEAGRPRIHFVGLSLIILFWVCQRLATDNVSVWDELAKLFRY